MRIVFFLLIGLFIASLFLRCGNKEGEAGGTPDWTATLGRAFDLGPAVKPEDLLLANRDGQTFALSHRANVKILADSASVRRGRLRLLSGGSLRVALTPRDDQFLPVTATLTADRATLSFSVGEKGADLVLDPQLKEADQPLRFAVEDPQ